MAEIIKKEIVRGKNYLRRRLGSACLGETPESAFSYAANRHQDGEYQDASYYKAVGYTLQLFTPGRDLSSEEEAVLVFRAISSLNASYNNNRLVREYPFLLSLKNNKELGNLFP